MKPKISVVTVVYNAKNTIQKTIESVLNQQYENLEYIIIDGGSTDGTWDIIQEYLPKLAYANSKLDAGIYDAMNKGLSIATGELVHFKNAGDYLLDGALEKVAAAYEKTNGNYLLYYGDSYKIWNEEPLETSRLTTNFNKLKERCTVDHRTAFFRTDWHKTHPYDTRFLILADYNLFLLLYTEEKPTFKITDVLGSYTQGGVSDNLRTYEEMRIIQEHYFGEEFATLNYKRNVRTARKLMIRNAAMRFVMGEQKFSKWKARKRKS